MNFTSSLPYCLCLGFIVLVSGCNSYHTPIGDKTRIIDVRSAELFLYGENQQKLYEQAWAKDSTLFIKCNMIEGINLSNIVPSFYDGNLYLNTEYSNSGGARTEIFAVDLSKFGLAANWTEHVYFISKGVYSGPFKKIPSSVLRLKLHVEQI